MKKVYKILLVFILSFIFINEVNAEDPYFTSVYTNKYTKSSDQPFIMFSILQYPSGSTLFASPMSTLTYAGETKTPKDFWMASSGIGGSTDIKIVNDDKAEKIDFKAENFKNKKYLYYDIVKNGAFSGTNKLYLSDKSQIDQKYDMIFEKTEPYKQSEPSSILDEMMCTYGPGEGQTLKSSDKYISIRMIRENEKIKYQVYLDFDPVFEQYEEIPESYEGFDGYISSTSTAYSMKTYLKDHFSPRNFWNEKTGVYGCPSSIMMGYDGNASNYGNYTTSTSIIEIGWDEVMDTEYTNSTTGVLNLNYSYKYPLVLYTDSSYVDAKKGNQSSQICVFSENPCDPTIDKHCNDKWDLSIKEDYYLNGNKEYILYSKDIEMKVGFKKVYYDIKSGIINEDCNQLPSLYTNCYNGDRSFSLYNFKGALPGTGKFMQIPNDTCLVSSSPFVGSQEYKTNEFKNEQDITTLEQAMGIYNGFEYKQLICELKPKLSTFSESSLLRKTSLLDIYNTQSELENSYNILDLPCSEWGADFEFNCTDEKCKQDLEYHVNKQIRETLYYCQDVYTNRLKQNSNLTLNEGRYNECKSFESFYNSLVDNGIINDLLENCNIFSGEMKDKLNFILDIIKIAGPVLAILLGMLDFVKVLAAGDADKEMKTAWNNFKIRLFAAFLLFLVPIILSMLINIFIGDKIDNNPYCGLLEMNESE